MLKIRHNTFTLMLFLFLLLIESVLLILSKNGKNFFFFLIVALYLIEYCMIGGVYKYHESLFPIMMNGLLFIRYFVLPSLCIIDSSYFRLYASNSDFYGAFLIIIYEEFFVGIYLNIMLKKWYGDNVEYKLMISDENTPRSNLIIIAAMGVGLLLNFLHPNVFNKNYHSILDLLNGNYTVGDVGSLNSVSGSFMETLTSLFLQVIYILYPIIVLQSIYFLSKRRNNRMPYYYASYVVSILPYLVFLQRISRAALMTPIIASSFIMMSLYPEKKTNTIITSLLLGLSAFVLLSMWKQFNYVMGSGGIQITLNRFIKILDSYFQGFENVGKGVNAYYVGGNSPIFKTLLNDILGGVLYFYRFSNYEFTSTFYFDIICGRTDQVIPISIQGMFWFTPIFSPVVVCAAITIVHKIETKIYTSVTLPSIFIYSYAVATLSYGLYTSATLFMQKMTMSVLPALIVVLLNEKINIKLNHLK